MRGGNGRTPKAQALRLSRAKARLWVHVAAEYRGESPLPPQCEAILVALSARDVRRYDDDLDGDGDTRYSTPTQAGCTCSRIDVASCCEMAAALPSDVFRSASQPEVMRTRRAALLRYPPRS